VNPELFQNRSRWLLWPLPQGNAIAAICGAAYVFASVRAERADTARAFMLGLLVLTLLFAVWALRAQSRVRTVRHLASGRLATSEENLIAAIREVRALPDWLRQATLVMWAFGAAGMALGIRTLADVGLQGQLRIASLALTCGPLASVMVYLFAVRRARELVELIAAGLPARRVLAALEGERKQTVRSRLMVLTVILVVPTAAMVADASRIASLETLHAVVRAPRADQADLARELGRPAAARVLLLAALLAAFALYAASLTGQNLADPMRHVADEANRISRGDLRDVRLVAAEDEVWVVTSTFTLMQAQFQEIIGQLQKAGISIGATTEQLMATSSKYESGAADQASSLNETSATTEELAQSARQISHNAGSVSELAQKTLDAARAGQDSATAFISAVDRMKHDNNSIAEAVTRLQKRVQQIGRIVEFINAVADRSDLLALSAELEGTKAGDVGRGFTLVAAEMRRLAENVIESTNEIEELIGEIREATLATVGATGRGMEHTESGTSLAGAVREALQSVVALAQSTSDSVRAISLATQQQQTSTDQLAEAMADILGITQQSLAATKQVTSANHELITLSGDLKSLVDRFQVRQ
jgi:methyl-accepting chemotaxis protein